MGIVVLDDKELESKNWDKGLNECDDLDLNPSKGLEGVGDDDNFGGVWLLNCWDCEGVWDWDWGWEEGSNWEDCEWDFEGDKKFKDIALLFFLLEFDILIGVGLNMGVVESSISILGASLELFICWDEVLIILLLLLVVVADWEFEEGEVVVSCLPKLLNQPEIGFLEGDPLLGEVMCVVDI